MQYTLNTEIGLLAIWDSKKLEHIQTREDYMKNIVEQVGLEKLMEDGNGVFIGTGGDGTFNITVRINPTKDLEENEEDLIEDKWLNKKLNVTSERICLGSPEFVGKMESEGIKENEITLIKNIQPGTYKVDVYFLYDGKAEEITEDMTRAECNDSLRVLASLYP